jgi:hypothetical protein
MIIWLFLTKLPMGCGINDSSNSIRQDQEFRELVAILRKEMMPP